MMDDPTLLVEHVYELFITKYMCLMRDGQLDESDQKILEYLGKNVDDVEIFFYLHAESRVLLNGKPLHNKYINFYTPQDTTDIYTPSKLYIFINVTQPLNLFQGEQAKDSSEECAMRIFFLHSGKDIVTKKLLLCCSKICHHQAVTDLMMENVNCLDPDVCDVFRLSMNAKTVRLDNCSLPATLLDNLLSQLCLASEVNQIYLTNTKVEDSGYYLAGAFNKWGANSTLKWFGLWNCFMSVHVWCKVLRSLSHCASLELLHLSSNIIGEAGMDLAKSFAMWGPKPNITDLRLADCYISVHAWNEILKNLHKFGKLSILDLSKNMLGKAAYQLVESIKEWRPNAPLTTVNLSNCFISRDVSGLILKHLSTMRSLSFLDLTANDLSGNLSNLNIFREEGMYTLSELYLVSTWLNKEDMYHLSHLMETQKFPSLVNLYLQGNIYSNIEQQLQRLIAVCAIHHQRELVITLDHSCSEDTKLKLHHSCKGSQINLYFDSYKSRNQNRSILQCLQSSQNDSVIDLSGTILGVEVMDIVKYLRSWESEVTLQELILRDCKIAPTVCGDLLDALAMCRHITHLDLSGNILGDNGHHLVKTINFWRPTPTLRELDLTDCALPEKVCRPLLSALGHCVMMTDLWMPGNTLTGCLSSFLSKQNYHLPDLKELFVSYTRLNQKDLNSLTKLVQSGKLPQLEELDIGGNYLCRMESELEEFIDVCVTHHQVGLKVNVWYNFLSASLAEKWTKLCQNTCIELDFGSEENVK